MRGCAAIARVGGLSLDTLAEDTDLTLTLHRLGYRIEYAPEGVRYTLAVPLSTIAAKTAQ